MDKTGLVDPPNSLLCSLGSKYGIMYTVDLLYRDGVMTVIFIQHQSVELQVV